MIKTVLISLLMIGLVVYSVVFTYLLHKESVFQNKLKKIRELEARADSLAIWAKSDDLECEEFNQIVNEIRSIHKEMDKMIEEL